MSTPDQPERPRDPQDPTPSGPPAYGSQEPGETPRYGQQSETPQYGEGQTPQYGQGQAPQYGQGQAPQYGAPQAPQYGQAPGSSTTGENPGRTMGIIGLVLSFLGCLSVVGIILSIVALNRSKKAGYGNGVAVAGIIVGAVVLIATIVGSILFFSFVGEVGQELVDACEGQPSGTVVEIRGEPVTCP
ncbi:DUF4190 domain-containing protein [Cellulosimicrobium sp. CUA-896]|uniref:DUF4190 domain-containing protein n=1 Tax=Cellulosimicrobium sp. CUA-896 TaxID=1517881 RepID=UPI00095CFAC7|nr:DUF4190 domain-containing protein [Cellulosimicrobium sp. CUA-896]OLT54137.1 hypothetical protein BJF88_10200 [Cellulosimicrobium sp. CUA-896]